MSNTPVITLDHGIFVVIMHILADEGRTSNFSTLAAMSQTCKRMCYEGGPLLLRLSDTAVVHQHIASFCSFMLRYRTTRLPLLRRLDVDIREVTEDTYHLFDEVLRHAANLYYLRIEELDHPSPSLNLKLSLCSLIASLTSIRHLDLRGGRAVDSLRLLESLFRSIRAPLSSIFVDLPMLGESDLRGPIMYARRRDPIFLLSRLRGTLKHVQVVGSANFGNYSYACQYIHVKKLQIPPYYLGVPIVKPLIVSFPHLHALYLWSPEDHSLRAPHDEAGLRRRYRGERSILQCRNINQQDQQVHGTWSSLWVLKATIVAAYALGLSCHVAHLHLLSSGGKRGDELYMFAAILSASRPLVLRLALRAFDARGCMAFFSKPGWFPGLQALDLRVDISEEEFNYEEYWHCIGKLLSASYLWELTLELRCANMERLGESADDGIDYSGKKCEPYVEGGWWHCYTESALLRDDLWQRVRACLRSSRTLRHIKLIWAKCAVDHPTRILSVDLNNTGHFRERWDGRYHIDDW